MFVTYGGPFGTTTTAEYLIGGTQTLNICNVGEMTILGQSDVFFCDPQAITPGMFTGGSLTVTEE